MPKVVLGLSDGVDSAVAAKLLMDAGCEVHGLYMDISGPRAREDAMETARALGIPLRVIDIAQKLEACVCAPFVRAYLAGKTPNPCIGCNPNVKMPALEALAGEIGADAIATGHYAHCEGGQIFMGEPENDQSYMLCRLTRAQAQKLLLPLGAYKKARVREIARSMGLRVADKPDSRENCFIRGMSYAQYIESRAQAPGPGDAVYHGRVIGTHGGIHLYTVGQRWGETPGGRRLYVAAIRAAQNQIELKLWEDLFTHEITVENISWLADAPAQPLRAAVRVRHTRWETPECTAYPLSANRARIVTDTPLRAPARGQTAALYAGARLLGGGEIGEA